MRKVLTNLYLLSGVSVWRYDSITGILCAKWMSSQKTCATCYSHKFSPDIVWDNNLRVWTGLNYSAYYFRSSSSSRSRRPNHRQHWRKHQAAVSNLRVPASSLRMEEGRFKGAFALCEIQTFGYKLSRLCLTAVNLKKLWPTAKG